jgi:hypothetical protein
MSNIKVFSRIRPQLPEKE